MSADKYFKVRVTTNKGTKEGYLPTNECLQALGKNLEDITTINWDSSYYPKIVYTEPKTATYNHPLQGSGSASLEFADSSKARISTIAFQDYNPSHSHFGGREHWNFEFRVENLQDKIKDTPIHQLEKTPWADIEIINCSNTSIFKTRLTWVERKP